MKTGFLVVYDYGMGGLWAVINAESRTEITRKYPMLEIFEERPTWMTKQEHARIAACKAFDIDDEPPNWLRLAVKESS